MTPSLAFYASKRGALGNMAARLHRHECCDEQCLIHDYSAYQVDPEMAAKFTQVFSNWGVDDDATPNPWMMVPADSYSRCLLREGVGLTLSCDRGLVEVHELQDPAAVRKFGKVVFGPIWQWSKSRSQHIAHHTEGLLRNLAPWLAEAKRKRARLFAVRPMRVGNGQIRAVDSRGVTKATLDVSVKRHRKYRVAFHFVRFGLQKTTRSPSELHLMLARINGIFGIQTNVHFRKVSARRVTVKGRDYSRSPLDDNDGDDVLLGDHNRYFVAKRDRTADVNVFFVHELQSEYHNIRRIDVEGVYVHRNRMILMEDCLSSADHSVLAHELGHFLLCKTGTPSVQQHVRQNSQRHHLMYHRSVRGRQKISKVFVNRMNP